MTSAHQKGTLLESVVAAIETLILQVSPDSGNKSRLIESRKRVEVDGVQHEIDLYVTTEIAHGYVAVFIFECKNWKEKVDKNEIIVFSEKIKACAAQSSYFIARSFTSDAEAQAKKDPRIILKIVTEHDPAATILPFGFHYTLQTPTATKVQFKRRGAISTNSMPIDASKAEVVLDGTPVSMESAANKWVTDLIAESMRTFPSGTLPDGTYDRSDQTKLTFDPGRLLVNGLDIETVDLEVTFQVDVRRPAVKSHFEVSGRGNVITLEGFTYGQATFHDTRLVFGPST